MASSSSADRADRIWRLFNEVAELAPEGREVWLSQVCRDDPELRCEVESLLAAHAQADAVLGAYEEVLLAPRKTEENDRPVDLAGDPLHLVGQRVSHYRIEAYIGGGGMGVVYRADDTKLGRTVALKFLPPELTRDAEAKARFLHEARAAAGLEHTAICSIHEIGEAGDGQLFIAMAYYEGETLKAKLARGALPVEEALDYVVQLAEGLQRAHEAGIVHRDVKPANVMVTERGRVKILDFGLAKVQDVTLTRTGSTLGTVAYMSPEQARGEAVDHRTDIWGLGAVLYEMLSGTRPFHGNHEQAVVYGVLHAAPQPLISFRPGLSMPLVAVVDRALAKPPDARYQHMDELLQDLTHIQRRQAARASAQEAMLPSHATHEAAVHDAQLPYAARPAALTRANGGEAPIKILVVDDEPEVELLIRKKFRRRTWANEWTFVFASDGIEALETLQADPEIALLLADLFMPRMDGLTLLARLAELDRPLKTLVVSAYGDMANIRTAMNRGAFDFVTKPINFQDLEATIEKAWRELRVQQQAVDAHHQVIALRQEVEVARRIQEAMLPPAFPKREDVDLYAFKTVAQEVCGDFYDFFLIDEDHVGFAVGNVATTGVSAALFTALSQGLLKSLALQGTPPGACLSFLNEKLYPEGFPSLSVTIFYGLLDTETGRLTYSNAGHPAPYVLRGDGTVAPLDEAVPMPVWRGHEYDFPTCQAMLAPGERLFLYTGGVIESVDRHGSVFSGERLVSLLRQQHDAAPAELIRNVVRGVMRFSDGVPQADDLTVLALHYRGR